VSDLTRLDGLFVGMLTEDEVEAFSRAVKEGKARRSYEGGGGLMGLAKVRLNAASVTAGEQPTAKRGGEQ